MRPAGSFRIDADHPCLAGHFPGHPVVPGVVLLDEAFALIRRTLGCGPPRRIAQVKFLVPVLPDQTVAVAVDDKGGAVSFTGHVDGLLVMRGGGAVLS